MDVFVVVSLPIFAYLRCGLLTITIREVNKTKSKNTQDKTPRFDPTQRNPKMSVAVFLFLTIVNKYINK